MAWYSENLGVFNTAKPFSYGGLSYPATIFKNPDALMSATIYPLEVHEVDSRYYLQGELTKTFANNKWTFTYAEIEKDFETLQKQLVRTYLNMLDTYLSNTDKFITRSDEMATWFSKWEINPALQQWRDGVYLLFNVKMNAITEAVTYEGLIVADTTPMVIPSQPNPYEVEDE